MNKQRGFKVQILGVRVDFLTMKGALCWVEKQVKYNKAGQITTPNPEQVVLAQKDEEFRCVLNNAQLNICDGIGLLLAAKFLGKKAFRGRFSESLQRDSIGGIDHKVIGPSANISSKGHFKSFFGNKIGQAHRNNVKKYLKISKERFKLSRLSGVDLMLEMCKLASKKKWKIFLLGGKNGVAEKAARNIESRIMNYKLRIMFDNGTLNIKKEIENEKKEIIKKINKFRPNLLFVAYGAPGQEKWIAKNLPKLKVNVAMGVGGAFDYISGKVGRAPEFVRKIGLEWLWRLAKEPWRVKRQLSLVKFLWLVISQGGLKVKVQS